MLFKNKFCICSLLCFVEVIRVSKKSIIAAVMFKNWRTRKYKHSCLYLTEGILDCGNYTTNVYKGI